MDEVVEIVTSEYIAGLLQEANSHLTDIEMNTNSLLIEIQNDTHESMIHLDEINESVETIEGYISTGFFLLCITLTVTLIVKTFFTGW